MKTIIYILFCTLMSFSVLAQTPYQDIVYIKNGDRITGKIIKEVPKAYIILHTQDMGDFTFQKDMISFIRRADSSQSTRSFFNRKSANYFSVATGYGTSYGGLGFRFQHRFGGKVGLAYHLGIGLSPIFAGQEIPWFHPNDKIENYYTTFALGTKFFFYKWFYLDVNINFASQNKSLSFYRASYLLGADWFFSPHFGINAAFGKMDNLEDSLFKNSGKLAFDFALVYKFNFKKRKR